MGRHKIELSGLEFINGCKLHNDCFNCPFDDCKIEDANVVYERGKINWQDPAQVRAYQRNKQRQYREQSLRLEFPHLDFGAKEKPASALTLTGNQEKTIVKM